MACSLVGGCTTLCEGGSGQQEPDEGQGWGFLKVIPYGGEPWARADPDWSCRTGCLSWWFAKTEQKVVKSQAWLVCNRVRL